MNKFLSKSVAKRLAMLLVGIVTLSIGYLTSCSNQGEMAELTQSERANAEAYASLMEELNLLTATYTPATPQMATRSIFSKLWRAVKADFKGTTTPTTKFGITLSISQSVEEWKKNKLEKQENIEQATLCSPEETAHIVAMIDSLKREYLTNKENLGAIHNAAILTMFVEGYPEFSNTRELAENTVKALQKLGMDTEDVSIAQVALEVDKYFQEIDDEDDHITFERLRTLDPSRTEELNVLEKYFSNVQSFDNMENIQDFTVKYVELIKNSSISYTQKYTLISNISIAPASFDLWNNILP